MSPVAPDTPAPGKEARTWTLHLHANPHLAPNHVMADWQERCLMSGERVPVVEQAALDEARDAAFRDGVESVLSIRCPKHYNVPQLNTAEATGAECGACCREASQVDLDSERGVLAMTVARLGGTVEGEPTQRINFLQRIDELREIEGKLAAETQRADELAKRVDRLTELLNRVVVEQTSAVLIEDIEDEIQEQP